MAAFLSLDARPWLAGLGIFLLVWMIRRRAAWIYLAAGCAFAALQVWQTRDSPSARLAELVGNEPAVATVQGRVVGYSDGKPGAKIRFLLEVEELELRGETLRPACRILVSAAVKPPLWNDRVVASGLEEEVASLTGRHGNAPGQQRRPGWLNEQERIGAQEAERADQVQ